ncbi:MAG: HAD hydrolase-like protein [Pseudomonadales bacterium]
MRGAVFFDLDGTLTDPKIGITRCIQYALDAMGAQVPEADTLLWCIGPPLLESFTKLVGEAQAATAVSAYRERFAELGWRENTPYQGIESILGELQAQGTPLYVATSKPHMYARKILEHFDLQQYFIALYGAELDGTRSAKTELLAHALQDSKHSGSSATMIGDRLHDVHGALANDMQMVGVSYGYGSVNELQDAGAHQIVHSPAELLSLLIQQEPKV